MFRFLTDRRYLPARGLFGSVIVHAMVAFVLLSISASASFSPRRRRTMQLTMINLHDPNYRLYLPLMGAGSGPEVERRDSPPSETRPQADAPPKAYAGARRIRSESPNDPAASETIVHPKMKDAAPIIDPPALPNIIQIAAAPMMLTRTSDSAARPAPTLLRPDLKVAESPKASATVDASRIVLLPAAPQPVDPLLALTPLPVTIPDAVHIPDGDARAGFSISPDVRQPGPEAGSGAAGAEGDKEGRGGVGGVSIGAGNGRDAFPGITILGGSSKKTGGPGTVQISINPNSRPVETSYGVTILSTETSGGGLPQFGVFSTEQIYTVYLDMRATAADPVPSWTMEYALLKPTDSEETKVQADRPDAPIVLPFPIAKEQPAFPSELVRKYPRRRMIVYGVINAKGKFEALSIKESPDGLLDEPLRLALSRWTFRPAQKDGESVAMKVLIGVPLFAPAQ